MATVIDLTPGQPVVVAPGGSATNQNLTQAIDVSAFDMLDLQLVVLTAPGTGGLVTLITGMQTQSEDGWKALSTPSSYWTSAAVGTYLQLFDRNFLRYVRWSVASGTGASISFYIRGMGRKYGA
jgi:hypothetical protein